MVKIEIKSIAVNVKSGVSAKSGKPYSISEQEGWAYLSSKSGPNPYPSRILINLEDGHPPYPVGSYTVAPWSLYVGDFSGLRLGRLELLPLQQANVRAA
jgi:hypothetical protein